MTNDERQRLIDQLDRSWQMMPRTAKIACKHALNAPANNPQTGKPFESFREVLEASADHTLETLRDDFSDNGDLLSQVRTQ